MNQKFCFSLHHLCWAIASVFNMSVRPLLCARPYTSARIHIDGTHSAMAAGHGNLKVVGRGKGHQLSAFSTFIWCALETTHRTTWPQKPGQNKDLGGITMLSEKNKQSQHAIHSMRSSKFNFLVNGKMWLQKHFEIHIRNLKCRN